MKYISWLFGFVVLAIGLVNSFWGNDPFYGLTLVVLSLVYFPPVTKWIFKKTGYKIPYWLKILLGVLILWTALGVAELFDKVNLMLNDFN